MKFSQHDIFGLKMIFVGWLVSLVEHYLGTMIQDDYVTVFLKIALKDFFFFCDVILSFEYVVMIFLKPF